MVDSLKEASSSVNLKEKNSFLDDKIGKQFLSSWTSASMPEDDAMDFQFETAPKGKKKVFNFENLDMDFSLDGDFDKISSFKVDMPDLDFSCAPKRTGKAKERSEDPISEIYQAKQDHLSFSFDFNNFSFDSSSMKGEQNSKKSPDSEGTSPDKATLKPETPVGGLGNFDFRNDNCPSNSETIANLSVSHGDNNLAEDTMTAAAEEVDQQRHPSEETVSTEPHVKQTIGSSTVPSASGNGSIQDTVIKLQAPVCLSGTNENTNSGGEQTAHGKVTAGLGPDCGRKLPKKSPSTPLAGPKSSNGEKNKMSINNQVPLRNTVEAEPAEVDLDIEATSVASLSKKIPHDKARQESQNSTSKLLLSPSNSDKPTKEKVTGVVQSRLFKRSEEAEFQACPVPPTCSNIVSRGRTRIGTLHLNASDERRDALKADAAKLGCKAIASPHTRELTALEPTSLGSRKNFKDIGSIGESFSVDAAKSEGKLIGNSGAHDKEATKGEPRSENKLKDPGNLGLIRQTPTASTPECANSKPVVSSMETMRNSIISSIKRTQFSSLKAAKRIPDLSSLKISRTESTNNDPLNSTCQKQSTSLQNPEPDEEVQRNVASGRVYSVGPQKQTPVPSLKRKTFEEANVDILTLNPPKRLTVSPNKSRKATDTSEMSNDRQVCNNSNMVDSTSKIADLDCQKSTWDFPMEVSMLEVEVPSTMENDGTVEKAEACTKELEDTCNMLKKKHEEARELLVRAVVNNNNLLMLNHPICEEKFQMVQRFADQLISKELQT